jgi:hypothetical protein
VRQKRRESHPREVGQPLRQGAAGLAVYTPTWLYSRNMGGGIEASRLPLPVLCTPVSLWPAASRIWTALPPVSPNVDPGFLACRGLAVNRKEDRGAGDPQPASQT